MKQTKSIKEVVPGISKTPTGKYTVRRRLLDEIINDTGNKEPEEVRRIIEKVFEKQRGAVDQPEEEIYSYAEMIESPCGERGDYCMETLGEAIGSIICADRYANLSEAMEGCDRYIEEDWFRAFNRNLCRLLLFTSDSNPDIRHMLRLSHKDFVAYADSGSPDGLVCEDGTVEMVIRTHLEELNRGWNLMQPYEEYAKSIRDTADRLISLVTKPLLGYYKRWDTPRNTILQ